MASPLAVKPLPGSEHHHPVGHKVLSRTAAHESITMTLIVRRRRGVQRLMEVEDFVPASRAAFTPDTHEQFATAHGADPQELDRVAAYAQSCGMVVVEKSGARRSLIVRGEAGIVNLAFAIELHDYVAPGGGSYRGHEGPASLPEEMAELVEAVVGLDNRQVAARHYATPTQHEPRDPPNTQPLTPIEVAHLYEFPPGNGTGQTIGLFEMQIGNGRPGYAAQDLARTLHAYGGSLKTPVPINVSIDGVVNSEVSDKETCLDITVASAVAQGAEIVVYFTGSDAQGVIHALQSMIHPGTGEPRPTILSISYGWGPDDAGNLSFSAQEFAQIGKLFQDAANLSITVLVATGDSGASIEDPALAQTSYPATEPWVLACGGSTIGNVRGDEFDEYVWNDTGAAGHRATGGGVSARFALPAYQKKSNVPRERNTERAGRGIPDLCGNASENSGYVQFINGGSQVVGGTSAVAPLYAGLIARINGNLGFPAGFINPSLYALAGKAFRDVSGLAGPTNNSYGRVRGYWTRQGWDPCTGLGSVKGTELQHGLKALHARL